MRISLFFIFFFLFFADNSFAQDTISSAQLKKGTITCYNRSKVMVNDHPVSIYKLEPVLIKDKEAYNEYKLSKKNDFPASLLSLIFSVSVVGTAVNLIRNENVAPFVITSVISVPVLSVMFHSSRKHMYKAIEIYNSHL